MDFKQIFKGIKHGDEYVFQKVFNAIKPMIINKIISTLQERNICHTGRPITTDFNKFLDALFFVSESGSQFKYVQKISGITKGTFYRYLKFISDHHIIQDVYQDAIKNCSCDDLLITDTFTVKSMSGKEGLGRNPTDRGRNGFKVSLIADTNRVVRAVQIAGANKHDSKILVDTIDQMKQPDHMVKCLCDAGYVGKKLRDTCRSKNFLLIVKPKRTNSKGKMSHILLKHDAELLRVKRNQIELLNGQIRRFRSLMIKWVRHISIYSSFLYVALLSIACHQLYVDI